LHDGLNGFSLNAKENYEIMVFISTSLSLESFCFDKGRLRKLTCEFITSFDFSSRCSRPRLCEEQTLIKRESFPFNLSMAEGLTIFQASEGTGMAFGVELKILAGLSRYDSAEIEVNKRETKKVERESSLYASKGTKTMKWYGISHSANDQTEGMIGSFRTEALRLPQNRQLQGFSTCSLFWQQI
jgi:hypothetical protein